MTLSGANGIEATPPRTELGRGELGEDGVHRGARTEVLVVERVDLQAGSSAAGSEALCLAKGPGGVPRPGVDPQLLLQIGEELLRAPQATRKIGAHLHHVLAGAGGVEHDVEGGDLV